MRMLGWGKMASTQCYGKRQATVNGVRDYFYGREKTVPCSWFGKAGVVCTSLSHTLTFRSILVVASLRHPDPDGLESRQPAPPH
jgi:hypothetical protein